MKSERLNLVESWLSTVLIPGMSIGQAVRDLNDALGTQHSHQRLNEWRRGDRPIPQPIQDYMLRCCIEWVLHTEGVVAGSLDDDVLGRIAERLTPPTIRSAT